MLHKWLLYIAMIEIFSINMFDHLSCLNSSLDPFCDCVLLNKWNMQKMLLRRGPKGINLSIMNIKTGHLFSVWFWELLRALNHT